MAGRIRIQIGKRARFNVLRRDGFRCVYCGASPSCGGAQITLHVDHVDPVSLGGANDLGNLVTACQDCNLGKSNTRVLFSPRTAVKNRDVYLAVAEEAIHYWNIHVGGFGYRYDLRESFADIVESVSVWWAASIIDRIKDLPASEKMTTQEVRNAIAVLVMEDFGDNPGSIMARWPEVQALLNATEER